MLFLAVQSPAAPTPPDGKPVQVWIDAAGPLVRGASVRVYVRTAVSGNLVVLQRRTDGRIQVLFPAAPTEDPRVRAGSYEIRGPGDRPALMIAEPDGSGMILAAVSGDPIWFDEFARATAWNPDALTPSWKGADPEGALGDIVQRMLGDGTFNYDVVTYFVAPAVVAQAPQPVTPDSASQYAVSPSPPQASIGTCIGCTVVGSELVVIETPLFFGHGRRFRDRGRPAPEAECHAGQQCDHHVESAETSPLLAAQHAAQGGVPTRSEIAARRRYATTGAAPAPEASPVPVEPRRRDPSPAAAVGGATVALLPGRMTPAANAAPRALAGAAPEARSALASRYVHFRPSVPTAEAVPTASVPPPAGVGQRLAGGAVMTSTVLAVSTGDTPSPSMTAAAPTAGVAPVPRMGGRVSWPTGVATAASGGVPSSGAPATATTTGGGGVTTGSQTVALPLGVWRGTLVHPRTRR